MGHPVERWWDEVWARTRLVEVLAGGEGPEPLDERTVLARIDSAEALAELRALSTRGTVGDDRCRCLGSTTLALCDGEGQLLGRASLHGNDALLWEGGRFCGNLDLADPAGLLLLLARQGTVRRLALLSTRLAYALELREGRPQFRQAGSGPHGARLLETRRVPDVLRARLREVPGRECADLDAPRVDDLRVLLAGAEPDGHLRALALLAWLGRLPEPMEAGWGEGVLVRALLRGLDPVEAAAGSAWEDDPYLVLGLLRWADSEETPEETATDMHGGVLADLVAPVLRRFLPPEPAPVLR
ncbi:hypothetical protein ACIQM3_30215 [Streptomyces sp. NPDC091271]|uniref:hypothetical protein n=1 Tax=Streptomyces sp. NPDC091271 TaxID=3365980 RepID=UPI0037F8D42C